MANAVKNDKNFRNAIGEKLNSGFIIERADAMAVNEEGQEDSRIVELSFASNKPIAHWFGYLELDMNEESVRLERMNQGAALLWNHNWNEQIGVVESVSLDSDGKARATVKFSRSECGEENYQDVLDGIKRNVSVGFMLHTIEQKVDGKGKQVYEHGEPVYISRDWEPFEISLVSIPADFSVGVGRSLDNFEGEKREMEGQNPTTQTEPAVIPPVVVDTRSETLKRIDGFLEIGKRFANEDLARKFAADKNKSEDDLLRALYDAIPATTETKPAAAAVAAERNSGVVAARSVIRYGKIKAFKGEGAEERAYRFGQWFLAANGLNERAVQYCKDQGISIVRAQSEGQNEKGGFLVPEEFGNDLIDLREQYGVFRRNAKVVPMGSDTKTDPRRKGGLTAYFVGESEAITESEKQWDRVGLTAKKIGVLARITSELNEDSVINVGDDLMDEIAYAFAYKEDLCGFNGDGAGAVYGGITGVREKLKGVSGTISSIAGLKVGTGNAYSELTLADFRGVVSLLPEYADNGSCKWFVNRKFYWDVMVGLLLAAGGVTAQEIEQSRNKTFLGYPVEYVQVMPKTEANSQVCALLGDLSKAARFGARRGETIAMSEHSRFAYDEIEVKGTERFDINVHDVGDTTDAGPIVGLITAAS